MRKPQFAYGLLLRGTMMACLAGQACNANAETILIDDFNDGNDSGWLRVDDSAGVAGPGIFDATTGEYNLKTTGFAFVSSYWDLSFDPLFSNGYLRAKVKANSQGTTVGLGLRADTSFQNGYYFVASTANDGFNLYRQYNSEWTLLDYPSLPFAPGEEWFIEAGAVGDLLSMKVWRVGEDEPASPQLEVHDSFLTAGRFCVEAHNGSGSSIKVDGVFDDIYFTFPEPLLGDLNLDGEVNGLDVDPFVDVLLNGPYQSEADMNEDQVVNGLDVDSFVAAVVGGDSAQIPEPSTVFLALIAISVVSGRRKWGR